jgi:organic hydroperoxide reductase OsmC/OhrA
MRAHLHRYRTELTWRGSTGGGDASYDRTHRVTAPAENVTLTLGAAPESRGNPELPDPEQLLLATASSCQLLSFLALAAGEGVDVVSYDDAAEALMPGDDTPGRIARITLRPRVVVACSTPIERVRTLMGYAHHDCFIATRINAEITLEPEIRHSDGTATKPERP